MHPVKYFALALLASSAIGLGAAQTNGVLLAGQTLPQVSLKCHSHQSQLGPGVALLAFSGLKEELPGGCSARRRHQSTRSWCMLQDQPLLSPDGRVSLVVQGDGNLVLYNTQVAARVGYNFASALFFTGTFGASPPPFSLIMTQVRGNHLRCPHVPAPHWQRPSQ